VRFGKTLGAFAVGVHDGNQSRILRLVDRAGVSVSGATGAENRNSKFVHMCAKVYRQRRRT
jgi:hypothetical protein